MKSRWYLKFPASIRFFVSFFLQGFVTFSGGYHSRSKFFPPKNNSGPVFPWVSSIIAYHEKLRGPPPQCHPPPQPKGNQWFFSSQHLNIMGGAEPHLCFSFHVAQRCKLLLCIVDVTTEPWPKKTNGVWPVGSFLETISFQVDAIADVWCNMYMTARCLA